MVQEKLDQKGEVVPINIPHQQPFVGEVGGRFGGRVQLHL